MDPTSSDAELPVSTIDTELLARVFPQIARSEAEATIAALVATLDVHEAGAGEALVAQGTASDELFLVVDGRLDISISTPRGDQQLAPVVPGQFFGEMSLLDPGAAGASVITEQGATVLRIGRRRLDALRSERPDVAAPLLREVLRSLADRIAAVSAFSADPEAK